MKKNIILVIFFLSVNCFSLQSQDSLPDKDFVKPEKDSTSFSEVVAYKMLFENQMKSNDAILKTIFYALGGLATAVILVIGGNWWFNTKKVEDLVKGMDSKIESSKDAALAEVKDKLNTLSAEKTSEINQIQIKLQEEVTANITNLTLKFSNFSEKVKDDMKEESQMITLQFEERLKNYSENLLMQIKTIETLTNERSETLNQKNAFLQENFSEKIEDIKNDFSKREKNIGKNMQRVEKSLQASIYRNAGYMWEIKKIYLNALMFFTMEGQIHTEQKNLSMLELSLGDIINMLEKNANEKIDDFRLEKLNHLLNNLPPEQIEKANRIKMLLEKNKQ